MCSTLEMTIRIPSGYTDFANNNNAIANSRMKRLLLIHNGYWVTTYLSYKLARRHRIRKLEIKRSQMK
jgi:hypothetical protein